MSINKVAASADEAVSAKIVSDCSLPLTGRSVVHRIITDLVATAAPLTLDPALELT